MRGGDDDTVPVDLVEVDSPDALLPEVEVAGERRGGRGLAAPTGRRRRRILVGLSAAVVLGLAGAGVASNVLEDRRADARWDALAARGLPLVDLASPVQEAWRLDFAGYPMAVAGDVVVVQAWDPVGSRSPWRGIDLATGEVLWERADLGSGWCTQWNPAWSEEEPTDVATARSLLGSPPAPPTLLVCSDASFDGELPAPGSTATVRVVEIVTGREVGLATVEGELLSFEPVGHDVVMVSVVPDGTIDLARVALSGGTVRWAADTDVQAFDPDDLYVGPWSQVDDGLVSLVSPEGVPLDVRTVDTGEPVDEPSAPAVLSGGRRELPDGSVVEVFYPGSVAVGPSDVAIGPSDVVDAPTVTVTGPDGEERVRVEGELWTPLFSDGSMADRVVVSRFGQGASSLVAFDVETGEELWTSRAPWSSPVLQVDGVVVTGSGYLSGVDLRTGAEVWERQLAGDVSVAPVTDGSRILVPITERGATTLVALDVRTGAEAWRGPTVTGVQFLVPMAGGVLVVTNAALRMYR